MMKIKESIDEGRTIDNGQLTTDKKKEQVQQSRRLLHLI
jgi:hypothetical protein